MFCLLMHSIVTKTKNGSDGIFSQKKSGKIKYFKTPFQAVWN